jgi:RNA polymerase sigma-70 factor, ECF subfamily
VKDARESAAELVTRARGGCRASFGELVERHARGVYNFVLPRARSHEDAEEIVQECFLRAWRKLDTYRADWSFSTWIYAVARSVAIDRARTRRDAEAPPGAPIERTVEPEPIVDGPDLWSELRAVLEPDQHSALWLFYAEDRSTAEIGAILGRTPLAIRMLLFRARAAARGALDRKRPRERDGARLGSRMEALP